MKRVFAFLLVLAMVLSLGITAYAEEAATGSITITNATIGVDYNLYKIFDATYAKDEDGDVVVGADGKNVVSYTITDESHFFAAMFGADGTQANTYFVLDTKSGVVTRQPGVTDEDITKYLEELADRADITPIETVEAETDTVVFESVAPGYYLVDRGVASAVTITTNLPDVNIIDKNQKPNSGGDFDKQIWNETTKKWDSVTTASVGDMVQWKITFDATNYDEDEIVEYYSIRDKKDSSLWIEFEDITIEIHTTIDGEEKVIPLTKRHYYCADQSIYTSEWEEGSVPADQAEWYLVHYGYDDIEIVIPWLTNYTFEGKQSQLKGYKLTYDHNEDDGNEILSTCKFGPNSEVVVKYTAAVGADASLRTVINSAKLEWGTPAGPVGPENPQTTETKVYNLGITKIANDRTTTSAGTRLAGAVFKLYRAYDAETGAYSDPVYVIPTNNVGVYILDDYDTEITGRNRVTAREKYDGHWQTYIAAAPNGAAQRQDMTTPASGQLVVLGLEAGTYYLEEVVAPEGYNKLTEARAVEVGTGTTSIYSNDYKNIDNPSESISYSVFAAVVENNRGVELPSTGGEGTMLLITVGSMIAMAFAVLLITHKKMSVYHD